MRKIAAVVAALTFPVQVHALGIGDIDWSSGLNQPLSAEIELFSVGSTSQHDIKVKLASFDAYNRSDIEYPSILRELKFSVEQRLNGELYIKVRSTKAIQDPFLDILIEVDWPSGHLLREYTLLLDFPVMTDTVAGPISSPTSSQASVQREPLSGSSSSMAEEDAARLGLDDKASDGTIYGGSAARYTAGDLRYGMVKRGDTLWAIAESMRQDKSVSVQQIMMALLKNNPNAFYKNNINNLKAGYVLRLDDTASLRDLTQSEAARAAKRHHQAWLAAKKATARRIGGSKAGQDQQSIGSGAKTGASGPSLKLVAPDDADVSMTSKSEGSGGQSQDFTVEELESIRQGMADKIDASASSDQGSTQLRVRIVELEDQISKMQRLLTLRDDALSVLQVDVVPAPGTMDQPLSIAQADVSLANIETTAGKTDAITADAISGAGMTPEAVKNPIKVLAPVKPAPVPFTPVAADDYIGMALFYVDQVIVMIKGFIPSGIMDSISSLTALFSPKILGGIAGGILLLVGGGWFLRRRKLSADDLEQSMMIEVADKQLSDDMANGTVTDLSDSNKEETGAVELLDSAGGGNIEANIDEIDVLAEADVYLAYQRFDRAEDLMREAVENEPNRHDLMLKLMEVFVASENSKAFIETAERCKANGGQKDPSVWGAVIGMSKDIAADNPLFSEVVAEETAEAKADKNTSTSGDGDDLSDIIPGVDLGDDFGTLDDDLMAGLDDDLGIDKSDEKSDSEAKAVDELSDDLGDLDFGDDNDPVESASTEVALDDGLDFDADLDISSEADDTVAEEKNASSAVAEDDGLEFDLGLDMPESEEPAVATPTVDDSADEVASSASDDDNSLDFDMSELSTDDTPGESTESATIDISELSSDDDQGYENDEATVVATEELPVVDDAAADEPVSLETTVKETAIDEDLSEDIDWLTSVADDAAESDNAADNFFSSEDEIATKLDLIRAYIDMGDRDSARNILTEVVDEGNNDQKQEAEELLRQIG